MRAPRSIALALAFAGVLALGCSASTRSASSAAASSASRPYVVLVSFDALRHDYLDRFPAPAFASVAARGVRASAMIPSFPSKTFPNHYTIATGLYPGDHGIVGNTFFDPARKAWYRNTDPKTVRDSSWYGGEPIWVTAEHNGVKSGVYFWTGSEAAIEGVRPTYWVPYNAKVPNAQRVDDVMAWLRKPAADRPHLVLLYFSEVDDTTHKHGPDAPETALAVASVDRALRRLLDSLAATPLGDSTNVVLVSDHGMAQIPPTQVIAVADLLARGGVDTTHMEISDNGPTMSLWFHGDSARMHRARTALDAGMQHARSYLRSETPARWHVRDNPRAGDLMLVAEEGWILQRRSSDKPPTLGAHGYDPVLPDMQGIFLAEGPGVRPAGTIAAFENVNVYPFLAALLRLEQVPKTDGSLGVLRTILR
jgi:predicted AlkP superfamily pyrophosphatase or phosphodiesterase